MCVLHVHGVHAGEPKLSCCWCRFCDSLMEWSTALLTSHFASLSVTCSVVEVVSKAVTALQQREGPLLSRQVCTLFSAHLSLVVGAAEVLQERGVAFLQQLAGGRAGIGALRCTVEEATDPVAMFSALIAVTTSCEDSDLAHKMATNLALVLFPSGTSQSFAASCVVNVALAGLSSDMVDYYGILLLQRMAGVPQRVLLGLQIVGSHHSPHANPAVEVCEVALGMCSRQCVWGIPMWCYPLLFYSYIMLYSIEWHDVCGACVPIISCSTLASAVNWGWWTTPWK